MSRFEWKDGIALLGVLAAFVAVTVQQCDVKRADKRNEQRIATMSRIFYFCQTAATKEEIRRQFDNIKVPIDADELDKAIYEMLKDRVLIYNIKDQKYQATSYSLIRSQ